MISFVILALSLCIYQCVALDHPGGNGDQLNQTLDSILHTLQTLSQDVSVLKSHMNAQRAVAFTAALSRDQQLGSHQTIEYDTVYSNVGNVYAPPIGHFTAPVHGIYQFSTKVAGSLNKSIHVEIAKNGVGIGRTYAKADFWEFGAITTVVELNAGDVVWVRHLPGNAIQTIHGANWSMFSGVLIKVV